jgi:DNA-binding protein HU-beta
MLKKSEIIDAIAKDAAVPKTVTEKVFNSAFNVISKELAKGEKVIVHGFGSFTVKTRAARKGRNPQTGKEIQIPAKKTVGFKASTLVRDQLK